MKKFLFLLALSAIARKVMAKVKDNKSCCTAESPVQPTP